MNINVTTPLKADGQVSTLRWNGGTRAMVIRRLCVRKGLPLGELARRAGVSRTTLYHLANGTTARPHASTLARIADVLEVDPRLLDGAEEGGQPASSSRAWPGGSAIVDRQLAFRRSTNAVVQDVYREQGVMFEGWSPDEWAELYSAVGTGGPLSRDGVVQTAEHINRKRRVIHKLQLVLETHLREAACEVIETLFEIVRPVSSEDRRRRGRIRE